MMLTTSSERLDRAREIASEILNNWRLELAALARDATFAFLRGDDRRTIVALDGNTIVVTGWHGEGASEVGRIEREQDDLTTDASALARLCAENAGARDVVLEIPKGDVLHVRVRMPKTSRRVLGKALHYELARLSPVEPERLYFDFEAEKKGAVSLVHLRIVKRETVDAAISLCHAAHLNVAAITFAGDTPPADWRAFPINRIAFVRSLWRRWNIPFLAALALVLGLGFIPAAYIRGLERADALADQLADAQTSADLVEHIQDRSRLALAERESLDRLRAAPLRVAVLADLARILPDGTWVTELTIEGDKLRLEGFSRSASDLIALFDRSNRFANAQFTAPLTRESQAKVERFDLALDIKQAGP
jgi:general secretion pathway protein L